MSGIFGFPGRFVEEMAPAHHLPDPGIVSPGRAMHRAERAETADKVSLIAGDAARRLLVELGHRDTFYYPKSVERAQARSTAVELAARECRVNAVDGSDFIDGFHRDIGRENSLRLLASSAGEVALAVYGRQKRRTGNRHYELDSVTLDDGSHTSAVQFTRQVWAPQYAADLAQLAEASEATGGAEAIS